jgi:uncharacterized membrane protein
VSDFSLVPTFSWWVALLVLGGVLWAVCWGSFRGLKREHMRWSLGAIQIATLALISILLLQPRTRVDEVTVIKPQLAVLVDDSESMQDKVDPQQPTRAERVREWMDAQLGAATREHFDIRVFKFDARLNEASSEEGPAKFNKEGSNVLAAVQQTRDRFLGQPLAAVLLLSDGLDSSGLGGKFNLSSAVPVHTFELEKPFELPPEARRSWISALDPPGRLVVGWEGEIRANISANGLAGRTAAVELWRDGVKAADSTVSFNENEQTRPVTFPITATEPGLIQFEMRLVEASADPDAKSRAFAVEVVSPGKRILYVQDSLGFEFKFLRKAVAGDRSLPLQAFVRAGDGRLMAIADRGNPLGASGIKLEFSQAGLANYAVVVLGDLPANTIKPEQYREIRDFVDRGGGLVLLGGPSALATGDAKNTALAELSPVHLPAEYKEGKFPVKITDVGLRHAVLGPLFAHVQEFPPLLTANVGAQTTAAAEVLVEGVDAGQPFPMVVAQRYGKGRVVAVMTDTVWHWRMGAKNWSADRSPYDVFWTQIMEWLVPKEQEKQGGARLELMTERPVFKLGERPQVRAVLETGEAGVKPPASLPLTLRTPDGKVFQYRMKPGQFPASDGRIVSGFVAEVEPNVPGAFVAESLWEGSKAKLTEKTQFIVEKPAREKGGKPVDRMLLEQISQQTGGKFLKWDERDRWSDFVHVKEQQIARARMVEIWNHPALLFLILVGLSADWILRKRWNLP